MRVINTKVIAGLIIVLLGGVLWWYSASSRKTDPTPALEIKDYRIFTEVDAGATVRDIIPGSIVIIGLPREKYGEPIRISDDKGTAIEYTLEDVDESFGISFTAETAKTIQVNVAGIAEPKKDFSLTLIVGTK